MTDVLAVIPARSGSKGIPNKNIRELGGKPLIAHQIKNALDADTVDRTILSTDSDEIAAVGEDWGAEVPFQRPETFATDDIPVISVYEHAREYYVDQGDEPTYVVGLQPTCPFTTASQIDEAVEKAAVTDCDAVVSISKVTETHPYRSYTLDDDRLKSFENVTIHEPLQRQDRPDAYGLTGAIFVRHRTVLEHWDHDDFALGDDTRAVVQSGAEALDIDTPFDLKTARALLAYEGKVN